MNSPGNTCVPQTLLKDTLQMLKQVYPILMRKAIAAKCESTTEKPYLGEKELVKMFVSPDKDESQVKELLKMAQFLALQNPKWKLYPVQVPYSSELEAPIITSMQELIHARLNEYIGLVINEPEVPWQCAAKNKLLNLFTTFLFFAIVGLTFLIVNKVVISYMKYREKKEKQVFNLVSEIINMLETHYQSTTSPGGTQESYLAVNHIRDNLIPPKDRKHMNDVWEKAVKFLDENESRIRKEVQFVSGEEFQVWRWLPNNASNSPKASTSLKMSKVWQGSAFETMDGSVNSPSCPPTPCLKIRHMFDPDVEFEDDWETRVKDAILEKCNDGVKILHIKVDRGSREGCVYIKCMSQEDAGQAYKALHGSWFDGHLVTVKYLRLERYHERFPEAVTFKIPLKPSNNQRLSMQAHNWLNSTDAN
ncbi:inner nuclear membrane protein Man1 [Copidosoma floridanum]|uniref:inner nuclear membrane protein Man1 n=1 Tax=Copidosoma floridanum TaxID=29053 RepID=UPI0006C9623E|nr:inner nuclear membrane protein Man1 [Copidosoma floridanum]